MAESRSGSLFARFFAGFVTLVAGAAAGSAALAPAPAASADLAAKPAAAVTAAVMDTQPQRDSAAGRPGKFEFMAARLLALSLHDTDRYARIEAGDSSGAAALATRGGSLLAVTIATLPDPVDSHEDWLYDACLESIRRAHEHSGYVVDRMWLPWGVRGDSVLKDPERTPVRAAYPGVLLFRSLADTATSRQPRWRIVLLVGEVATAGPHPRALAHALAERDHMVPAVFDAGGLPADTLEVLGPSFSGSAYGLRTALSQWIGTTHRHVNITTGSATSPVVFGHFPTAAGFTFRATINSDAALARQLARLVPHLGLSPNQLAVVAEGSTAYGQAVAEATAGGGPRGRGPLRLFFPLNIAMLRGDPGTLRAARAQTPGPGVALTLTDAPRPMEAPLPTSELTSPTVDILLDQIARTLRNHDIRAVTIAASDIRDRIFLLAQLRARLRDVRFIVLESNQLYLAPKYNPDFRGSIVLSSYPLILESQLWGKPHDLVPFSDETAQAVYNAALLQLGDSALVNYALPDSARSSRTPPVWTSVVGGSGLMPLAVEASRDGYATAVGDTISPLARPDPRLDFLELSIVLGLLSVSLWLLWRNLVHQREVMAEEERRRPGPLGLPRPRPREWIREATERDRAGQVRLAAQASLRSQETLYRFLLVVALAGGLVPPTVLICAGALSVDTTNADLAAIYAAAAALALLVAFVYAVITLATQYRLEYGDLARRRAMVAIPELSVPERLLRWAERAAAWLTHPRLRGAGAQRRKGPGWIERAAEWLAHPALRGAPPWWWRPPRWAEPVRVLDGWLRDMWTVNGAARFLVLGLGLAYLVGTLAYAREIAVAAVHDRVRFTLLFYRAWRTDSGVSPLVPLALAAAAFLTWCGWHLRRTTALRKMTAFEAACFTRSSLELLENPDIPVPDPVKGDRSHWEFVLNEATVAAVRRVRERLFRVVPLPRAGWVALLIVVSCGPIFLADDRTLEHLAGWRYFDLLYRFGLAGVIAVTAWGVFRLIVVWAALKRALRAVAGTPLITAFERLPQRISRLSRLGFIGVPRSTVVPPVAAAQWHHLYRLSAVLETGSPPASPPLTVAEEKLRWAAVQYGREAEPFPGLGACGDDAELGENFLRLAEVLEEAWQAEPVPPEVTDVAGQVTKEEGKRLSEPSTSGRFRRTFSGDLGVWLRTAEEFAAVHVVDYVEWVISQLRTLAGFLFVSVVLLTMHVNTYPFVPESLVKLLLFAILVITIVVVMNVMVEMNRDEVLSRIARSEPGRVSWDWQFVLNLLVFGLVPLLTLISSEFPGIRDFLFSWVPAITRLAGRG